MNHRTKNQKGASTIEILIALVILIFALTGAVTVVFGNQNLSVDTVTNNEALYLAEGMLEEARALARTDFSAVVTGPDIPEVSGSLTYTKKLDVSDIDIFTKQATSTVTWQVGGRTLSVELSTLFTDSKSALGGDTCSPILVGDWTHPTKLGYADVGQNNGGTDVDVLGKRAYITANASDVSKHDFYIVDVRNPLATPLPVLGSIDTGPGLAGVAVAGRYAYTASMSAAAAIGQLQVIDILNSSAPFVASWYDATPSGDDAVGNSIFYADRRVYLGLDRPSAGPEFFVFDVTDPLNPAPIASFETNTKINTIEVRDGIAYLAVPNDDGTAAPEQLRVLDVSGASITELTPFSEENEETMSGLSLYLNTDGDTLYFGRGGANSSGFPQLFQFDLSTPGTLSLAHSKFFPNPGTDTSIHAIAVRDNLAFLWTNDTNLAFQVWDLDDWSASSYYGALNTEQSATGGFDCEGNYLYTAQKSNQALQIIGPGPSSATVDTTIHRASDDVQVSSVPEGTAVYGKASLSGSEGTPTGTVDFTVYIKKDNCSGPHEEFNDIALVSGQAVSSVRTVSHDPISYKVHYSGDSMYAASDGACVALTVN